LFVIFCEKWASGETNTLGFPALRALHFEVLISVFYRFVKIIHGATL